MFINSQLLRVIGDAGTIGGKEESSSKRPSASARLSSTLGSYPFAKPCGSAFIHRAVGSLRRRLSNSCSAGEMKPLIGIMPFWARVIASSSAASCSFIVNRRVKRTGNRKGDAIKVRSPMALQEISASRAGCLTCWMTQKRSGWFAFQRARAGLLRI